MSCLKGTGRTCKIFAERTKKGKEVGQYTYLENSAPVHCNLFYTFIESFFYIGVDCISYLRLMHMLENSEPNKLSPRRRVLFVNWKGDAWGAQLWMTATRGDWGLGASNWLDHMNLTVGKGPCVHVYVHICMCVYMYMLVYSSSKL